MNSMTLVRSSLFAPMDKDLLGMVDRMERFLRRVEVAAQGQLRLEADRRRLQRGGHPCCGSRCRASIPTRTSRSA